jgi:hypothetical protein
MGWFRSDAEGYASSADHLRDELHRAAGLVRAQLLRFQSAVPEANRERFWHLPDDYLQSIANDARLSPLDAFDPPEDVEAILKWVDEQRAAIDRRVAATRDVELRLVRLKREFELSAFEADALLLALLPHLHSTYRRWYGVLQHEPGRVVPTVGLLAEMLSRHGADFAGSQAALAPSGRLARTRLVAVGANPDDPIAMSPVVVEDRTSGFLLGERRIDARLASVAQWMDDAVDVRSLPIPEATANRLEMLPNLRAAEPDFLSRLRLEFSGPDPGLALRAFRAVAIGLGRRTLVVDVPSLVAGSVPWPLGIDCALRDARLGDAVPIFSGVDAIQDEAHAGHLNVLLDRLAQFPHPAAVEIGLAGSLPGRSASWIPFVLAAPTLDMRERTWRALLASGQVPLPDPGGVARDLAAAFQLTDSQIHDAWRAAEGLARRRNVFIPAIETEDLYEACRRQSTRQLVAFATRIEPRRDLGVDDVVLPEVNRRQLTELQMRIRNRGRIFGAMNLGDRMRLGRGITALFIGGSGTGKTMAAEVLASEQRVDLFVVDISRLVSKWVGETEKHLGRLFADAEKANCMLFFDEADSMFGQRGEIKEGHDRWANLEINYLLQRIEEFSGVVILATNFRQNIDDAFQRRIHVVVEFPSPDAVSRRQIWERLLPGAAHRTLTSADLDELAVRFELTGGSIRNIALDACYRALAVDSPAITLRQVIASTAREYQKFGRPVTRGEFGQRFFEWAMEDIVSPAPAAMAEG